MIKPPANFTHYGWLHGVPVYVDFTDPDLPIIDTRWYVPEFVLDAAEAVFGLFVAIWSVLDPYSEPMYAIKLTGLIKR